MGASGSKVAKEGARKFPKRAPGAATPPSAASAPRQAAPSPSSSSATEAPTVAKASSRPAAAQASYTKDDAILQDSINPSNNSSGSPLDPITPDFAARLRQMGVAQPNPIMSPSSMANPYFAQQQQRSSSNPETLGHFPSRPAAPQFPSSRQNATLGVLEARRQLEARAEEELADFGTSRDKGREFLDVGTIRDILVMRAQGRSGAEIEKRLRLRPGLVDRLGRGNVVKVAT